jgi:hypothetical protein
MVCQKTNFEKIKFYNGNKYDRQLKKFITLLVLLLW